uniref:Orf1 n=1 Tax=Galbut virus TaxID=1654579 RepID=A0A2Z4QKM7_9VIRU|nr:orf1 [Galbut virus]
MAFINSNGNANQRGIPAQQQQQRPQQRRPRPRDYERMLSYNQDRAGPSWAQQSMPIYEYERAMERFNRQQQPRPVQKSTGSRQQKKPADRGPEPKPTTVEQGQRDDPMYEGPCTSTTASTTLFGHNLDYSGYVALIREFYINTTALNPRLPRELPFCMFQHAMFGALHARLVQIQYYENSDPLVQNFPNSVEVFGGKDYQIPKIIAEYLDSLTTGLTPTGEKIKINFPELSLPQGPVNEDPLRAAAPSGTFGIPTALNHNVYECYPSPFISRRLIERTLEVNRTTKDFGDWDPFPSGWLPRNSLVNGNLLGYYRPEQLQPDALSRLAECTFADDSTFLGRIAYSPSCVENTMLHLSRIKGIELVNFQFTGKTSTALFAFKENMQPVDNDIPISTLTAPIRSPYQLGAPLVNKAHFFGFKRKRSPKSAGVFVTVGGTPPDEWVNTRNYNFSLIAPFNPRRMMRDKPSLREEAHESLVEEGYMCVSLQAWLSRLRKKE